MTINFESSLAKILELYHEYVSNCLYFDDSPEEIMDFGEYAELHHGIPMRDAELFFLEQAEGA